MCRTVTLVLLDADGAPRGALPPFEVAVPYWPEVADVVAAARERFGVEVAMLRLLSAERPAPHGGAVTYLAQVHHMPPNLAATPTAAPPDVDLGEHPRRAAYARPGGPAASLSWAAQALDDLGRGPAARHAQQRTWNLSAIWVLHTPDQKIWLKQVPRFFAHEPAVLRLIAEGGHAARVPRLIAADDGRMLLDDVPGQDLYGADTEVCAAIAADMHEIQDLWGVRAIDSLLDAGVPDRRFPVLAGNLEAVVARFGDGDRRLATLVGGLSERLAAITACGLPDTLVHGDLHPGNVRGNGQGRVIIDWGDSFVGHPGFDILRLTEELSPGDARRLIDEWANRWRAAVPGCDPQRAAELLRPVAALRNAAVYAAFLDQIEPAEHPYHAADVPFWLTRAADLAASP